MNEQNSREENSKNSKTISATSPHILVVDDDTRLRDLLRRYLLENSYRVTTARDADEARNHLNCLSFDLIVLDIMMPGESGLEFTERLRKASDVPILMLTARGEAEDRITGLERGADDYLPKPFEPRELLLRISRIVERTRPQILLGGEIALGEYRFDVERGELWRSDLRIKLSSSEIGILRLLASNPGRPLSRSELSELTNVGHERSIDVQITRLRKKIEQDPKLPLYLQTVRGIGYMLVPD